MRNGIVKIISGGQTGADRAGLDWAIKNGIEHGGWCPKGRRSEDGKIPPQYQLVETESEGYQDRTAYNVKGSDATVIFTSKNIGPGSKLTQRIADGGNIPFMTICMPQDENDRKSSAIELARMIEKNDVKILNVAGSRASKAPGIEAFVCDILTRALL